MKIFDIYKNYGCLGADKRAVYTVITPDSTAKCYDRLTVEVPAGWDIWESTSGELCATIPDGIDFPTRAVPVRDILCGDERPMLRLWTPDSGDIFTTLHICSVVEH